MGLIKVIFQQYWRQVLALAVFACAARRYWQLGNHFEADNLTWIIFAFAGLVLVLAGDEYGGYASNDMDGLTGDFGWFRKPERYHTFRFRLGPVLGGAVLVWATIALYRLR